MLYRTARLRLQSYLSHPILSRVVPLVEHCIALAYFLLSSVLNSLLSLFVLLFFQPILKPVL